LADSEKSKRKEAPEKVFPGISQLGLHDMIERFILSLAGLLS